LLEAKKLTPAFIETVGKISNKTLQKACTQEG
jgi:hypothetical protein